MRATLANTGLVTNERQVLVYPRSGESAERKVLVYLHGGDGDPSQCLVQAAVTRIALDNSWTVASLLSNNPANWGNAAGVASTKTAVDALRAQGYRKIYLYGISMGSCLSVRYLLTHPGTVDGTILHLPAMDMQFLSVNGNSPLTSAPLLTAWGGQAAWNAAEPNVNPARFAKTLGTQRIQYWCTTNDTIFGTSPGFPQTQRDFAAAAGLPIRSTGPQGHVDVGLNPDLVRGFLDGTLNS